MRRILPILLAMGLCFQIFAVPHPRPSPRFRPKRHRPPSMLKSVSRVPWQTILAGGAAAGGIVFAYKVSDGIETGVETAAAREPQGFLHEVAGTGRLVQTVCILCVLASLGYFAWRIGAGKRPPPHASDASDTSDSRKPSV